jgi:hypothetical protein
MFPTESPHSLYLLGSGGNPPSLLPHTPVFLFHSPILVDEAQPDPNIHRSVRRGDRASFTGGSTGPRHSRPCMFHIALTSGEEQAKRKADRARDGHSHERPLANEVGRLVGSATTMP